jgi:outer membrane receptor protein involved in Fe transport
MLGASPNNLFPPTNGRLSESEQFTSAVGRFVADYSLTDETNVFASVSRGRHRNVINMDADGSTILNAEIVWSCETGVKRRAFNEQLEYEANGFYCDYSNFQTSVMALQDGEFVTETRDSGAATALGFETAVRGALFSGVSVFGNYSYIDATFERLFGGLTMAHDFADLVQPWDYSVTAFPAQNGFCTRPVAPLQGSFGPRSCTSPAVFARRARPSLRSCWLNIHPPNGF